jgi:hypothetical protein
MAKAIQFVAGKLKFAAALTKIDRDKVYGFIEVKVNDDKGNPCIMGSLLDDGRTLVLNGATAIKTVDASFNELDKKELKVVYQDGKDAVLVPSSYEGEVSVTETTLDDLFNLEITSVYQLDFEDASQKKSVSDYLSDEKVARFVFNYRADYEGADAILISNADGIFALTGRIIDFPYLENKLAPVAATLVEETVEEEEGMDFGML